MAKCGWCNKKIPVACGWICIRLIPFKAYHVCDKCAKDAGMREEGINATAKG